MKVLTPFIMLSTQCIMIAFAYSRQSTFGDLKDLKKYFWFKLLQCLASEDNDKSWSSGQGEGTGKSTVS